MGKGKFTLTSPIEGSVTTLRLNAAQGGDRIYLNRGTAKIKAPGTVYDKLPPASQKLLRQVYDNAPENASIVTPPPGYTAPWQKFAAEEE